MFRYLFRHREQPPFLSQRFFAVWVKRLASLGALIQIGWWRWRLRSQGAEIGPLSIVSSRSIQGRARNLRVGERTFIAASAHIAAHAEVRIGSCVVLNDGVRLLTASHSVSDSRWRQFSEAIVVGDFAWIATGAMIMPGVKIGRGAVVAAGAVVTKDVPAYAVARGNPSVIADSRRPTGLNYDPVIFCAPYESWIGRNADLHCAARDSTLD